MGKDSDGQHWFCTHSGRKVYVRNPKPEDIVIEDIAHALSMTCRFGGHVDHFYSVAQHSVIVSDWVPPEMALEGLMHDAAEAYVGDIIKPLKINLGYIDHIEDLWHRAIAERFGFSSEIPQEIHNIDQRVFATECRDVAHTAWRDHQFSDADTLADGFCIHALGPTDAKELFLRRWHSLVRVPEQDLLVDPKRRIHDPKISRGTGIYVRAKHGASWGSYDIVELDEKSLDVWLKSRDKMYARAVVRAVLGHPWA